MLRLETNLTSIEYGLPTLDLAQALESALVQLNNPLIRYVRLNHAPTSIVVDGRFFNFEMPANKYVHNGVLSVAVEPQHESEVVQLIVATAQKVLPAELLAYGIVLEVRPHAKLIAAF